MSWYKTGTIAVTNGSTTVTGTGTAFVGAVQAGWGWAGPDGRVYEVASITSATVLVLATAYLGSTVSGAAYACFPTRDLGALPGQLQTVISAMQATIDGAGAGKFGDGTAAVPGVAFTADADTGLYRPASNQVGLAAGGVQRVLLSGTAMQVDVPLTGTAVQSSANDATAGRLMKTGAFGLGAATAAALDLNTTIAPGFYGYAATDANRPSTRAGVFIVSRFDSSYVHQTAGMVSSPQMWTRYSTDAGATWSPWHDIYTVSSILGPVAQTAGVPTGAVIERGSNANGDYARFADGTMICTIPALAFANAATADGAIFRSNPVTWTFPSPFSEAPVVSGGVDDSDCWISTGLPTPTTCAVRARSSVTKAAALNGRLMSHGLWIWTPKVPFAGGEQGAWYDPSDLTTLFQDSAGTTPVTAPGDPVGRILDKSGRGNHATQATAAARPTYQTSGGLHWLAFDGVDDSLTVAAFAAGSDKVQAFAGIRKVSDAAVAIVMEFGVSVPVSSFYITAPHSAGPNIGASVRAAGSSVPISYSNASLAAPVSAVVGMHADIAANDIRLRANGVQVASSSVNLGGGTFGTWPLDIGKRGSGAFPFNGNIFGLILRFGPSLTDANLANAEQYLAGKTGVTL